MAGASLLALLDDIATVLDDVAAMTKVAAKKTAGVLGDDLALNAQQVAGIRAERELPVVWAVAMGSFRNKLILVPLALALSAFLPGLVTPLLMLGGAYLCYEGFEKLAHKFLHSETEDENQQETIHDALNDPTVDLVLFEHEKIRGAIRTDFILSAEIIVIALGTAQNAPFMTQVAVVSGIALVMTVGVYGLVAGIVKLDDAGLYLVNTAGEKGGTSRIQAAIGRGLLGAAPYLMKTLAVVGTAAMFLVGGGILLHGLPGAHELLHHVDTAVGSWPAGGLWAALASMMLNALAGVLAGAIALAGVSVATRLWTRRRAA
jgi:predicted DNA repair protein MutK